MGAWQNRKSLSHPFNEHVDLGKIDFFQPFRNIFPTRQVYLPGEKKQQNRLNKQLMSSMHYKHII